MKRTVRVGACQVPEIREDPASALAWIEKCATDAENQDVRLLCFPEGFLQGYLVEDDAARRHALELSSPDFTAILHRLAHITPTLVVGMIESDAGGVYNTAVVISGGRLLGAYRKTHLVGNEPTVFAPGAAYPVFDIDGLKFGINICYDTNFPDAAARLADQGARLIVCPANNMMRREKAVKWKDLHNAIRAERAKETGMWLISSDVTGETDIRIALGPTAVIDPSGRVVGQVPLMQTGMVVADIAVDP